MRTVVPAKSFTIEIICVLLVMIIVPSSISDDSATDNFATTVYVGGSGSGNYSSIQDAIDGSVVLYDR